MKTKEIREKLFSLKDEKYADFQSSLMPTVPKEKIIGVRTPLLRALAKEILKEGDYKDFLSSLPHKYYEEDNLHGFILEGIKDYGECVKELRAFIPFIDNWATCDGTRPKVLKKHPEETFDFAVGLLNSKSTYTVRFGIGLLHSFYLDEHFDRSHLDLVSQIKSDEYYINMMIAWYFATALAKQYEITVPYIEKSVLSPWTHNKTIQKATESFRVDKDKKQYLKSLKSLKNKSL